MLNKKTSGENRRLFVVFILFPHSGERIDQRSVVEVSQTERVHNRSHSRLTRSSFHSTTLSIASDKEDRQINFLLISIPYRQIAFQPSIPDTLLARHLLHQSF